MEDGYLKVDAVAERLGVSRMTVYRMIHDGRIECVRVGQRSFRIPVRAVEAFIARNTQGPAQ